MAYACQHRAGTRCTNARQFPTKLALFLFTTLFVAGFSYGQADTATVSGVVTDQSGAVVAGAEVRVTNTDTNVTWNGISNGSGVYLVTGLKPGRYRLHVGKDGFKGIDLTDLILNVQDSVSRNFTLQVGSTSESVSVEGSGLQINTQDAAVSTVVDRQFADNLPMNGRSFQSLIELAPGVVIAATNVTDGGQFSINGQRPSSNYWMVDGVSANIGVSATNLPGSGLGGALGSFSVVGGTNSLVSVDAMQEFRIQTSTYAPEFGRSPGGQISIVTRSGANQFHGTGFDYLRNDLLDANDWFANSAGLRKAEERQNDFGGTLSGAILKDKTFFFFSYEGLRLRLPQVKLSTVPCDSTCQVFGNARATAVSTMQPYLNAFPLPNGSEVFTPCTPNVNGCPASGQRPTGTAEFNSTYSNAATLDAYSLRIDHKVTDKWHLFGRYNYSPSKVVARGAGGVAPLSVVEPTSITTQTATLGTTWMMSPAITNDLRFNYSRTNSSSYFYLDTFRGAVPLGSLGFPSPFTVQDSSLIVAIFALKGGAILSVGRNQRTVQRQYNIVDGFSMQEGGHSLKFGVDFRRLSPMDDPVLYNQFALFFNLKSAQSGNAFETSTSSGVASTFLFRNFSLYAQDTWRVLPRLTLTYGLRWDVDFAPSTLNGPNVPAVTGYNLSNLANLALAPAGTPPFSTPYGNVAPRLGLAYQVSQRQSRQTVLRGGAGVFYDLASSQFGSLVGLGSFPFGALKLNFFGTFPLDSATAAPPAITASSLANSPNVLTAIDPHLKLPYTLQWNVALEQELGSQQSLSASYVGSSGRRLLQVASVFSPNPSFAEASLVGNTATSDYNALQVQFQRRLSRGLQALASYTWSHSIDDGSAGSKSSDFGNEFVPALGAKANRGPSDFDIRHAFSAGVTYEIPAPQGNRLTNAVLRRWSLQNFIIAFSAPPIDVFYSNFGELSNAEAYVRPDLIPGQPLYLFGAQCAATFQASGALAPGQGCPGGMGFNPGAFASPPVDANGVPLRQGNLGRNALRGFGAAQWDFAVHREFAIREQLKLQFRAEMFNVLNHPNFGQPSGNIQSPQNVGPSFGVSSLMLGQSLSGAQFAGNVGSGGLNPLYQIGGPRSIQFALKLSF